MGMGAARRVHQILDNIEAVLGIELLCAAQGREFNTKDQAGRGAEAVYKSVRKVVKPLGDDRYMHPDLVAATELVASGALVAAVEKATGELLA